MPDNSLLGNFKETEIGPIPVDWDVVPFEQTVLKKRVKVGKVKKQDYRSVGRFPVVDQGRQFIAGYWDDLTEVYTGDLPVIVFGDHTRIFKFVDFPFVVGADGVKVLLANTDFYDPDFLYFAFTNLKIPSKGYNRHFKLLKEQVMPLPPLPEQRRIAHVLSTIQRDIAAQDDLIAAARGVKRSLMQRLFTYGPGPEPAPTKETEIGPVPEHWTTEPLIEIATLQRGKDLSKLKRVDGPYPVVGSNGIVGYHNEYVAKGPGVLVGRSGSVGRLTYVETPYWPLNTSLWVKDFHGNDPLFVYHLLHRLDFSRYSAGVSVPTLNRNLVHPVVLAVPDLSEQQQIAGILLAADRKIAAEEQRKAALQALFKAMLHQLMTGQIRVGARHSPQMPL